MSYLVQYLPRACAPVRKLRGARVDEQILLNHPGYHGGAYVHVFVEDTSRRRFRRDGYPSPRFRARDRGLHEPHPPRVRRRDAGRSRELAVQDRDADRLAPAIPGRPAGGGRASRRARGRTHAGGRLAAAGTTTREEEANGLPEAHHDAPTSAVGADPGLDAGAQLGRRLHVVGRRLDTTPSIPRPRLRGRHATTRRSRR